MSHRPWLENLSSASLALVLAVMIWLVSTENEFPMRNDPSFPPGETGLPVAFRDPPPGRAPFDPSERTVRLALRARDDALSLVRPSDFEVSVNLAGAAADARRVTAPVQVSCRPCLRRGVRVVAVVPERITVRLGELVSRSHPVVVVPADQAPSGFTITSRQATPPTVVLYGAEAAIGRVRQVSAQVGGVGNARGDRVFDDVPVVPLDASGALAPDVTVEPQTVSVALGIGRRGIEVAVRPEVVGGDALAEGYYLGGVAVEPQFVQLDGPEEVLLTLGAENAVLTVPVDVAGARATVRERVRLVLPEGVTAVNAPEGVTVTVKLEALPGTVTFDVPVGARRLAAGLTSATAPESVRVLLSGPRTELERLMVEDIAAYVDLSGLGPGTHRLTPRIETPPGVRASSSTPEVVEVVVTGAEEGRRTATPDRR